MAKDIRQKSVLVYAHWLEFDNPTLIGTLFYSPIKGREVFSFEYDAAWLVQKGSQNLDPDLQFFPGPQYLKEGKINFGDILAGQSFSERQLYVAALDRLCGEIALVD